MAEHGISIQKFVCKFEAEREREATVKFLRAMLGWSFVSVWHS